MSARYRVYEGVDGRKYGLTYTADTPQAAVDQHRAYQRETQTGGFWAVGKFPYPPVVEVCELVPVGGWK